MQSSRAATQPSSHAVPVPMASTSLWCPQPCGILTLTVSPSMWHLHTPALFWGAGVSPGLWVIPGHPTVHRGCVPWARAVAQVWGLLRVLGQGGARGGESRRLFLGSTSHRGTESHGKGLGTGALHPPAHTRTLRRFSSAFIRTRGHQTPGSSFSTSAHSQLPEQKPRSEATLGCQPSLTSPDTLPAMSQERICQK